MNYLLFKKKPIFKITKSLNQYPNIKAQTSHESQPLGTYGNSIAVFDDMLLSKQENNNDLFFTRGRHINLDINYMPQTFFHIPKKTTHNNSSIIISLKQTLRDITLIFLDIAGLDTNQKNGNSFVVRLGKRIVNIYK